MREVLPELDLRARLCLSDAPYRLTSGGNKNGALSGCFDAARYTNNGEFFDMVEWAEMAPLIHGALSEDSNAIIMSSDRELFAAQAAFAAAGFGFHRLLVWDKITATPNRWYMPNCEFALFLYKGTARQIADCASKALIRCPQRDVSQDHHPEHVPPADRHSHPTEKPVALMEYWLRNSTTPGELVLDPFAGSGSTLVAALRAGRPAVGIEADPRWFDVAASRLRAEADQAQPDLLRAPGLKQEAFAL